MVQQRITLIGILLLGLTAAMGQTRPAPCYDWVLNEKLRGGYLSSADLGPGLAQEKPGWPFTTFGPPGGGSHGSFDASTLRCIAEGPEMRAMLYPQPLDEAGKQLQAAGKVTILDRIWNANLESSVGVPYLKPLQAAWAASPQRQVFVLQGHPLMWQGPKWDEFLRILGFLQAQEAAFATPAAYLSQSAATRAVEP